MLSLVGQCEACRAWTRGGLCAACLVSFAPARPRCARCALALGVAADRCGACIAEPLPFAACIAAADYGHPWDRLLAELKFHDRVELAGTLGRCLADAVRARDGATGIDAVLPVPLAAGRLRERGYNQAWELARHAARALKRPARADLLQRGRDTAHQLGLTRAERLRNLRHAFMVLPAAQPAVAGRTLALVDDVMTTGATAAAAAQALLDAGARAVHLWVVARTPPPSERGD